MKDRYIKLILTLLIVHSALFNFSHAQTLESDSIVKGKDELYHVAYGSKPLWMVTEAISTVKGSELSKSFTSNVTNSLYGRIPGLTVRQGSGEPGMDSPTLNARGVNTFGSGRDVLVIVDGFQTTLSYLEQLTSQEIESIVLLKDASATALYGNRAANGVLQVITRKGSEGPLNIDFNVQYGFQNAGRLPEFLGSYDYARLYNEGLVNDGEPAFYSSTDLNAYQNGSDPLFYPDVNWHDELLRSYAPAANYNLNFSGGDKTVRYFVLLNAMDFESLFIKTGDLSEFSKNSSYIRYNFRTNVEIDITKRLSSVIHIGGSVEDKTNPGVNENSNTYFNLMASVPPNAFPVYAAEDKLGGSSIYSNPLGEILQRGYHTTNGRMAQASIKLTEKLDMITPGMSISGAAAFNSFFKTYSIKSREYARYFMSKNEDGETVLNKLGQNTSLSGDEGKSSQWRNVAVQSFLNYKRKFGKHQIDAMAMSNYDAYIITGSDLSYKNIGLAGRVSYSFSNKYIGEFSFGYNGTENFPKGNRFGFFPAVSAGWVISNEDFIESTSVFDYLKIRGSYGLTGNNDIGGLRFMFDQYYNYGSSYYFGTSNSSVGTLTQGALANPDVTWEKEKKMNIGIEATLFDQIDFSFDYFNQDRFDILALPNRDVPEYLGVNLPSLNVGKVNNKGFEALVRYNGKPSNDFSYFVEVNVWYAKNKIVYNSEKLQINEYLYRTGQPVGQPFLLEAIGFFRDPDDIANSPKQIFAEVQPGDIKYKDQNDDGIIDQNDYYPIGKPGIPELTFSLNPGIKYKRFDIDLLFQGVTNRSVYLSGNYFYAFQNDAKVSSFALGRWTPETASTATYPRLSADNNMNNFQSSSFWQRDGSFIKLRSLEIGYTIPNSINKKLRLTSARLFLNGTNLFSLDHMDGFTDPETITGYPSLRSMSLGINIQF